MKMNRLCLTAILLLASPTLLYAQNEVQNQAPNRAQPGAYETTSLLGRRLFALPDDASLAAARTALAADPRNPQLALKLSLAQAGRRQYKEAVETDTAALALNPTSAPLLLERGHRELGLRAFPAAERDLKEAARLDPSLLDAHYHLGLALYFQGRFREAASAFARARDLAPAQSIPDDSLIDCSAWLFNSYRRANMQPQAAEVLSRITPAVKNTEDHLLFYLRLLHFYQGLQTAPETLPPPPAPGDAEAELAFNTISYGIGNWDLSQNNRAAAHPHFRSVVKGEAWNSWGFIASELELSHEKQ